MPLLLSPKWTMIFLWRKYCFDSRLVQYCRGDYADYHILKKACVPSASTAIVVAGNRKVAQNNLGSVLTTIALRHENPDIFIAAELYYSENAKYFQSSGADAIVNPSLISNRLIAISSLYPAVAEFVMDALTDDDHSEIYAISFADIAEYLGVSSNEYTAWGIRGMLVDNQINMVGVLRGARKVSGVIDADFVTDNSFSPLLYSLWSDSYLEPCDTVIFLAEDMSAVKDIKKVRAPVSVEHSQLCAIQSRQEKEGRSTVLIIGRGSRAMAVQEELGAMSGQLVVHTLETLETLETVGSEAGKEYYSEDPLIKAIQDTGASIVVILPEDDRKAGDSAQDSYLLDAKTIARTTLIKTYFGHTDIRLVAELSGISNRRLLKEAGADVVVPGNLIAERLLVKLVYSRGVVAEFLVALLSSSDGIHLIDVVVSEESPLNGMLFREALLMPMDNHLIFGWYPKRLSKALENSQGDFSYHFYMSMEKSIQDERIKAGDLLVMVARSLKPGV